MEIMFNNSYADAWTECFCQVRRSQTDIDCVVPDTQDDIGRLLSVQPTILLREKSINGRSALVRGEVQISLLYINELENAVSAVNMEKSWSLEYELPSELSEAVPQVSLEPVRAEARILNPRKVSVTVEVAGRLHVYKPSRIITGTRPPEETEVRIHLKPGEGRAAVIGAACEKSFIISETCPFSAAGSTAESLLSHSASFTVSEWQNVGSRVLVKGGVHLRVCCVPRGAGLPVAEEFDIPFSQLIDIGEEIPDGCSCHVVLTSAWFSLSDGLNGEKLLNTEIHALLQFVSRRWEELTLLTDAYCNSMESELDCCELRYACSAEPLELRLCADEPLSLPEDCAETILILPQAGEPQFNEGSAALPVSLDILYRTDAGNLSCIHRRIEAKAECSADDCHLLSIMPGALKAYRQGEDLHLHIEASLLCEGTAEKTFTAVNAIRLLEDRPIDRRSLPSVVAVRAGEETLWELAKVWHSSPDLIKAWNDWSGENDGRLLLIPRCD